MTRIAIIAALAGELKPLVRGWQHERNSGIDIWQTRHGNSECIAACAGMGKDAAARAFAKSESSGKVDRLISVGWAGALRPEIESGKAYQAAGVIDLQTGERFPVPCADPANPWLVTSNRVAGHADKARLAEQYGAGLVDMEAAAVARLAEMRGIPFDCFKGVSDGFSDRLPDFNRLIGPNGQLSMPRLLFFVLPRPWHWPALIRMGENSRKASHTLAGLLLVNLNTTGDRSNPNGNPSFSS
jgi:adenosylhomocysteine nucleosidase